MAHIEKEMICRICFTGSTDEGTEFEMLAPCLCKGSTKWIHRSCLDKWRKTNLNHTNGHMCEICHHPYAIIKIQPTFMNFALSNWGIAGIFVYVSTIITSIMSIFYGYKAYLFDLKVRPVKLMKLSLLQKIRRYYMYGYEGKKVFHFISMLFLVFLNKIVYSEWKAKNTKEIVIGEIGL